MKNFYFVRHALSQDNKRGVFSSTNDCKLAPEGVEQAIAAGKKLKGVGIDLIISSPLLRAVHTAELIAEQIGVPPLYQALYKWSGGPTSADHCWHTFAYIEVVNEAEQDVYPWGAAETFVASLLAVEEWRGQLSPHFALGA